MDFNLTEEQKMLQASARQVATEKLAPIADELDRKQEFAWDNLKLMCKLGYGNISIPPEWGGPGADKLSEVIVMEEIARACASTCDIIDTHLVLCTETLYKYGNEAQRKKYLPDLVTAKKVGSFAITEPEAGSDVSNIKTTAVREGNHYVLNGTKTFMTNGDVSETGVVFANIPTMGKRGMTAFIVEAGMPGFTKGKKYNKLGMRAATNADFIFENCKIPVENRLGEEGQGMKICLETLDRGRLGIGAQCCGITQAVLDKAVPYAKTRIQFGAPIGNNQGTAFKFADIAARLEGARMLTYRAAFMADQGESYSVMSAMGKLLSSELCMYASTEGIQIFGGYGYMMDSPMQRYFRDAKLTTIYEGTSEIQRFVISRSVMR